MFGVKKAPEIFHHLTQAVCRIMAKKGFSAIVVYLIFMIYLYLYIFIFISYIYDIFIFIFMIWIVVF